MARESKRKQPQWPLNRSGKNEKEGERQEWQRREERGERKEERGKRKEERGKREVGWKEGYFNRNVLHGQYAMRETLLFIGVELLICGGNMQKCTFIAQIELFRGRRL